MLASPAIQINAHFKGKNCNSKNSLLLVKNSCLLKLVSFLNYAPHYLLLAFFQTVQISLATHCIWGSKMSLTKKSIKMTLLAFQLYPFFMLTSTDEKCDNARVY